MFSLIKKTPEIDPIAQGISMGLIIATGAAAILAFHAVSFMAQIIATPIIFGIGIGLAVHIALYGPKESIECLKTICQKAPVVLGQIAQNIRTLAYETLQAIGKRVNPPSRKPYTVKQVAKGLVVEGRVLAQKAGKKSWEFVKDKRAFS